MEGEAQEAVLKIPENDITRENGVDVIINHLNGSYKKGSTVKKYQALECDMSIQSFLNEFEKRQYKTKSQDTKMSKDILAYTLLKSANLSNEHKQLVNARLAELQYD